MKKYCKYLFASHSSTMYSYKSIPFISDTCHTYCKKATSQKQLFSYKKSLVRQYYSYYFHTQKNVCIHLFHTIYRFTDGCVARAPHFPFWKTLKRENKLELASENIKYTVITLQPVWKCNITCLLLSGQELL